MTEAIKQVRLHFPFKAISKDNFLRFSRKTNRPYRINRFQDFDEAMRVEIKRQLPGGFIPFDKAVYVTLTCTFKDKRHADASNLPKSIFDVLNKVVWNDDRQVRSMSVDVYDQQEADSFEIYAREI